jgi:uncharacterized membrane protein YgcG
MAETLKEWWARKKATERLWRERAAREQERERRYRHAQDSDFSPFSWPTTPDIITPPAQDPAPSTFEPGGGSSGGAGASGDW